MTTRKQPKGILKRAAELKIVDVTQLVLRTDLNPRSHFEFSGLKDSIRAKGKVISPIEVRRAENGDLEVVHGERRVRAALELIQEGFEIEVPAMIQKTDDPGVIVSHLVGNDQVPLTPIEQAKAFQRLRDEHKMTLKQIGEQVGRSEAHVADRLLLIEASAKLIAAVSESKISSSLAQEIVRSSKGDTQKQEALLKDAIGKKRQKTQVRQRIKQKKIQESSTISSRAVIAKIMELAGDGYSKDAFKSLCDEVDNVEEQREAFIFGQITALASLLGIERDDLQDVASKIKEEV